MDLQSSLLYGRLFPTVVLMCYNGNVWSELNKPYGRYLSPTIMAHWWRKSPSPLVYVQMAHWRIYNALDAFAIIHYANMVAKSGLPAEDDGKPRVQDLRDASVWFSFKCRIFTWWFGQIVWRRCDFCLKAMHLCVLRSNVFHCPAFLSDW